MTKGTYASIFGHNHNNREDREVQDMESDQHIQHSTHRLVRLCCRWYGGSARLLQEGCWAKTTCMRQVEWSRMGTPDGMKEAV